MVADQPTVKALYCEELCAESSPGVGYPYVEVLRRVKQRRLEERGEDKPCSWGTLQKHAAGIITGTRGYLDYVMPPKRERSQWPDKNNKVV